MQRKPTPKSKIYRLVTEFEEKVENQFFHVFDENQLIEIISFYEEDQQLHKAIETVDLALSQYRYRIDFYLLKVRLLLKNEDCAGALRTIHEAEKLSPYEFDVLLKKSRVLFCLGEYAESLETLDLLRVHHPMRSDESEVYLMEAYIYEALKDYDSMFDVLSDALIDNPLQTDAMEKIWMAVEFSKRYKDSVEFHERLIDQEPYNGLAWYNLGHAHSCLNNYEEAIDALEYSYLILPDFQMAYRDCAELCMLTSNFHRAQIVYEEELNIFGPDCDLLCDLGACYLELGEIQSAIRRLKQAHAINPDNDEAKYLLASAYLRLGLTAKAIPLLQEALEIEDRREEYYARLADAYYQNGEITFADYFYRKATETGPEQLELWIEHAKFLYDCGEYIQAIEVLEEAEYHTVGLELVYCKAACFIQTNQLEKGIGLLEFALEKNPTSASILNRFAPDIKSGGKIQSMISYFQVD
jgi:tetratricopeptide (TPR) repeat protein